MCRMASHCIFDSEATGRSRSTCSLSDRHSRGWFQISVQQSEIIRVYDLERYFGDRETKRPDRLVVGRVGEGPWVVVLVELKTRTGWGDALAKFRAVLPALGKGGSEGGEQHHQGCAHLLPGGRGHPIVALVAGSVGSEYRRTVRGDRRPAEREKLSYGGKQVLIVPPLSGGKFESVRDFWRHLGLLGC
jgi:hypothetical protein